MAPFRQTVDRRPARDHPDRANGSRHRRINLLAHAVKPLCPARNARGNLSSASHDFSTAVEQSQGMSRASSAPQDVGIKQILGDFERIGCVLMSGTPFAISLYRAKCSLRQPGTLFATQTFARRHWNGRPGVGAGTRFDVMPGKRLLPPVGRFRPLFFAVDVRFSTLLCRGARCALFSSLNVSLIPKASRIHRGRAKRLFRRESLSSCRP